MRLRQGRERQKKGRQSKKAEHYHKQITKQHTDELLTEFEDEEREERITSNTQKEDEENVRNYVWKLLLRIQPS